MAYVNFELEQTCERLARERSLKMDLHEEDAGKIMSFMQQFQYAKVKYVDMCMIRRSSYVEVYIQHGDHADLRC